MLNFLLGGAKRAGRVAEIVFGPPAKVAQEEPDPLRRLVLTGAISAIAVGALAVSFPTDALADNHGRRRSGRRNDDDDDDDDDDDHSRRRSRNHRRRRSNDHGRDRSRRNRHSSWRSGPGWNDDCFMFGPVMVCD